MKRCFVHTQSIHLGVPMSSGGSCFQTCMQLWEYKKKIALQSKDEHAKELVNIWGKEYLGGICSKWM
jgi:hypothetical protein